MFINSDPEETNSWRIDIKDIQNCEKEYKIYRTVRQKWKFNKQNNPKKNVSSHKKLSFSLSPAGLNTKSPLSQMGTFFQANI